MKRLDKDISEVETSIFELSMIVDNPLFEGFGSNAPSLLDRQNRRDTIYEDFYPDIPCNWNWELTPLAEKWRPIEVYAQTEVQGFNDFPCLGLIPAFSARAVNVLNDFLVPNGELLPFTYSERSYYAYNCLKIAEILDHSKTKGAFASNYSAKKNILTIASSISFMSVIPERINGLSIFRMRELPNWTAPLSGHGF